MNFSTNIIKEKQLFEITITIAWEEFTSFIQEAAKKIGTHLEVPGFRKGNAPFENILSHFGAEKVYQEAVMILIEKQWKELVARIKEETVGRPNIVVKKLAPHNPVEVGVSFVIRPPVTLPDYKSIAKKLQQTRLQTFEPTEQEKEAATKWLLRSRAKYKAVSREAQKGDFVEIDFHSSVNGITLEGGASTKHPLILGEGRFMNGFEDALVGLKAGETKEFSLVAPHDYYRQELANKKINFSATMRSVQEVETPQLTDEFAQSVGNFKTASELQTNIAQGLTQEKQQKEYKEFQEKLLNELLKDTRITIPPLLIEQEAEALAHDIAHEIKKNKLSFEEYLKHLGKSEEQFKESLRIQATHNLSIAFLFHAIAKKENLSVTPQEVDEAINTYVKRYGSITQAKKEIDLTHLKTYTENTLLNQKVLRFLEKAATTQ